MSYNIDDKPTWSTFQTQVKDALGGMENWDFGFRSYSNQTIGVSARPRGGLSETLNFTLGQGPQTPWGPSVEIPSSSGWARNIGAQIWVDQDLKPHFKTPFDALKGYLRASYATKARANVGGRFSYVLQEGYAEHQLVGKTQMYSPDVHNPAAMRDYASRIGVRVPREAQQAEAWEGIYNLAKGAPEGDPLKHVLGMAPWKGSDEVTRLRRIGTTAPWREGEGWDYKTQIFGTSAMKALKQGNIAFEGGLREQADLLQPKEGGGLEVAKPDYIRSMSDAGYRWLNLLFPGETQRRAVGVQRGIFHTPGSPFSGGMVSYENQMEGIYSGAYPSQLKHTIKTPHIRDMASSQFNVQFGIFQQGEGGEYTRTGPLKGHVIEPGGSATIGMVSYKGPDRETVTTPIVQHASRQITLTGDPKLFMPAGFTEGTGKAHPGVMPGTRPLPHDYRDLTTPGFADPNIDVPKGSTGKNLYQQELVDIIKDKFPGEVEFGSKHKYPTIQVPYHTETGTAWKGSGYKAVEMVTAGLGTESGIIPSKAREVAIGAGSAVIKGLTAELKNPLVGFAHEFGALPQEKQAQMLEELGGHTGKVLGAYARQRSDMGKPEALSMDVLARKYTDLSGEQTSPWQFMDTLYNKVEQLSIDKPGYTLGKYGRGYAMEPQKVTLGYVQPSEMKFLKEEFYRGARLERGDEPPRTGREQVELLKQNMEFNRDPETGNYEWRISQPGLYATMASNITAEHMWKQPRLAFEEQAAVAYRYPEIAKHLGIGDDVAPGEGRQFTPAHVKAWKEVSEVYQYTKENLRRSQGGATVTDASGGLVAPPAKDRTTFNAEQMGELEMKLLDLGGDRPFEEYEKAVTSTVKGKGPLYSAESGAMMERPKTMGVVTETELDEFGKEVPLARMGKNFYEGLLDWTRGGTAESSKTMETLQRERRLADESSAKTVPKNIAGAYLREARGGRFVGAIGQGMQKMITSQANMDRMLVDLRRGSHIQPKGAEGKAKWLEGARADVERWGGLPSLFFRSPNLGREGSAVPVNSVTPRMVRKQAGLFMPEGSYINKEGTAVPGSLAQTGFTGGVSSPLRETLADVDADPNITVGLARATKTGLAQINLGALKGHLAQSTQEYFKTSDELLRTMAGEEKGVPGGKLDIFAEQFGEMMKYTTSENYQENIREWAGERGGLKEAPTEDIFEAGTKVLDSQMLMGQSYNVRRRIEAASSALGIDKRAVARGHSGAVLPYQTALDKSRFGQSNLERLMSTFTLQVKGGDATFMHRTAEGKFQAMPERNFGRTVAGLVGQDKPLPAHGAGLFAMNNQQFGQIEKSMTAGASMSQAVYGGGGFEAIQDYDITQTPIGLGLHSKAAGALLGLHGKQQTFKFGDLEGQKALPHMGGMMMPMGGGMMGRGPMTVGDWVQQGLVQETAAQYNLLTNRGTPSLSERAIMDQARQEGRGGAPATLAAQKYSTAAAHAAMVTADAHVAAQNAHLVNVSLSTTKHSPGAHQQLEAAIAREPGRTDAEYRETAEDVSEAERIRTGRGGPLHKNWVMARGEEGQVMFQPTSKVGVEVKGKGVQDLLGSRGGTYGGRKKSEVEQFRIMNKGLDAMKMADAVSKYIPATEGASGRWQPSGEAGFKGVGARIMSALGEATGRTEQELTGEYEELGGLGHTLGRLTPDQMNAIGAQFTGAGSKALKLHTAIQAGAGAARAVGAPGPMMSFAAATEKMSPIRKDVAIAAELESAYKTGGGKSSLAGRLQAVATKESVEGVDKALNNFEESLKKANTSTGELHELNKKERDAVIDSQRKGVDLSRAIRAQYMPALKQAISTRTMPGIGGAPGEPATNQQMLEMQEKYSGMLRGEATDTKRMAALNEMQRPISGGQLSRFTRKLIGGWGLFYLGHLASFPMRSWQYGYAEREQYEGQMAQAAGQYLGGDPAFPTTDYATRRSKIAAGGRPMGLMAQAGAGMPPSARDIGGAAMAGISGYAMSLFVGQAAAGVAPGLSAALIGAAAPIGIAAAVGGLAMAQASYAAFPETTMANLIASKQPEEGDWERVKKGFTWVMEGTLRDEETRTKAKIYSSYLTELGKGADISKFPSLEGTLVRGGKKFTRTVSHGWVTDDQLQHIPEQDWVMKDGEPETYTAIGTPEVSEVKPMETKEWQRLSGAFMRMQKELDPDITGATFLRLAPAGASEEAIQKSIEAQMSGVPIPNLIQGAMGAFRIQPSLEEGKRLDAQYVDLNMYTAMQQQTGQALAQQLSPTFIEAYKRGREEVDKGTSLDEWSRSQNLGYMYAESDFQQRAYEMGLDREAQGLSLRMTPEQRRTTTTRQRREDTALQYAAQADLYGADQQGMYDFAMKGQQASALAGRAVSQMPRAAALGLDMQKFTDDLTSGVQQAVVSGMALGVAETASTVGWDAQEAYGFASQGFQQAQIGAMAGANAQSVLATTGNMWGAISMRQRSQQSIGAARWNQRLLNRDPTAITLAALGRMPGQRPGTEADMQQYVTQAVTMGGEPTGRQWGSISLHQGDAVASLGGEQAVLDRGWSPEMVRWDQQARAGREVLGERLYGTEVGTAMSHGLQDTFAGLPVPEQLKGVGGTVAANWARGQYQYQSQMASLGAQMAQLNLTYAFQTGIGLDQYDTTDPRSGAPLIQGAAKGGFWGIQDKQMGLQKEQAQWNFQFQREGIELQSQQFFENFNINQRQSQMQRGWTASDWNFQDRMRGMQWDWQVEDFQEESRFMTGRERKKAETGMERATTMHDEEGKRVDETRQRQKEMWKLEDERFALQKKHFLEQKKRQEESLKMQEKFWKENFKLQKEQQDLQRAYFLEQQEIQKGAIGAQMYYAEKMKEVSDAIFLTGEHFHELQEQWEIAGDYYNQFVAGVIGGLNQLVTFGSELWARIQSGEQFDFVEIDWGWPEQSGPHPGVIKEKPPEPKEGTPLVIDQGDDSGDSTGGTESFTPLTTWGGVTSSSPVNLPAESGNVTVVVQVGNKEFENYIIDVIKKAI